MTRLRTAVVTMVGARMLGLLISMAGVFILARLLEPAEFGYFAIVAALYGVLRTLGNFGLRQNIISAAKAYDRAAIAEAVGLSMAMTLGLSLLCVSAALLSPESLAPPQLAEPIALLPIALLAAPISLAAEAQMHRDLAFAPTGAAIVLGALAHLGVAGAAAAAGLGTTALALGLIATEVVTAAVLLGSSRALWVRPRLSRGAVGRFGRFGGRVAAINIMPELGALALASALAGLAGPGVAGLYNRASMFRDLFNRALVDGVAPVVLPGMSRAIREGVPAGEVLAMKVTFLAALCWPAFAVIGVLAEPLVAVVLGPGWSAAAPAVQILALSGLAAPFVSMSMKTFTAIGELDAYLRIQATHQAGLIALGGVGAAISLEAFCAAMVAAVFLKWALVSRALRRRADMRSPEASSLWLHGVTITLAAVAGPVAVAAGAGLSAPATLALALPLAGLGWLAALRATGHPLLTQLWAIAGRDGLAVQR